MRRIVVWGIGRDFDRYVQRLKYFEEIGEIKVVGVTSDDNYCTSVYGYDFFEKQEIIDAVDYDAILATGNLINDNNYQWGGKSLLSIKILDIPNFSFDRYFELKDRNISIISNWCWGGITYNFFHHEFLSPFINLFLNDDDYIELLSNFETNINLPLKFQRMVYDVSTNGTDLPYPVGKLGNVSINFNHYKTWEEAKTKWEVRRVRLNVQNLFFVMITSSKYFAEKFAKLPFNHKVCFVPFETDIPCAIHVNTFERWLHGCTVPSNKELAFVRFVNRIAMGRYKFYNPWDLLLDDKLTKIVE